MLLELMDAEVKVPSAGNLELLTLSLLTLSLSCLLHRHFKTINKVWDVKSLSGFVTVIKKTWNFILKVAVQQRLSFSAKTGHGRWDCTFIDNSNPEFYSVLCVKMIVHGVCFFGGFFMYSVGAIEKFWSLELLKFVVALDFGSCKSSPVNVFTYSVLHSCMLIIDVALPLTFSGSVYAFTHYAHRQWIRVARLVRVTVLKSTWPHQSLHWTDHWAALILPTGGSLSLLYLQACPYCMRFMKPSMLHVHAIWVLCAIPGLGHLFVLSSGLRFNSPQDRRTMYISLVVPVRIWGFLDLFFFFKSSFKF